MISGNTALSEFGGNAESEIPRDFEQEQLAAMQAAGLDDLDMDNIADMEQPISRSKSNKVGVS